MLFVTLIMLIEFNQLIRVCILLHILLGDSTFVRLFYYRLVIVFNVEFGLFKGWISGSTCLKYCKMLMSLNT